MHIMSNKKDGAENAPQKKVKLVKKDYVLKSAYTTADKAYKKGDKIALTKEGRAYLLSIHKI